jgi:hypothetical protein
VVFNAFYFHPAQERIKRIPEASIALIGPFHEHCKIRVSLKP